MGLRSTIKKFFFKKKINRLASNAKYIHLMFNDKFNKPFVDFLNRCYDTRDHLVLCKNVLNFPIPTGNNVVSVTKFALLNLNLFEAKIICHSLFDQEAVSIFAGNSAILERTMWVIWGGDLYSAPTDVMNTYVRENFGGYVCLQKGDEAELRKRYRIKNDIVKAAPPAFPITLEMLKIAKEKVKKSELIRIQVNNSADKSTLDILDVLSRFRDENIMVTTVVSYGDDEYANEIISKGKALFGSKFEYLSSILEPQDFANYIASNDILVLAQERQRGGGNFLIASILGLKTFIRSDVTSFKDYSEMGIQIEDSLKIKNMNFSTFISFDPQTAAVHAKILSPIFTDEYLKVQWDKIYDNV